MLFYPKTSNLIPIKVQPNKAHSTTPVTITLTRQGQFFPNYPKIGKQVNHSWLYLGCYFPHRLHTWYQGKSHLGAYLSNDTSDYDLDHDYVKVTGRG